MIDFRIERTDPVINTLDHIQATITILAPTSTLKTIFALLAALAVLWLMQANTRSAGFSTRLRVIRLIQRTSMLWLVMSLLLLAASPALLDQFHDLIGLMVAVPLLIMVVCSIGIGHFYRDVGDSVAIPDDVVEDEHRAVLSGAARADRNRRGR